jgi:hypothetical protein
MNEPDKQEQDLQSIIAKAQVALQVKDPRHRRQLLQEICLIAAEYVVAK